MLIGTGAHERHVAAGARHVARARLLVLVQCGLHQRKLAARRVIRKRKLMTIGARAHPRELAAARQRVGRHGRARGAGQQMIAYDVTRDATDTDICRLVRHCAVGIGFWRMTPLAEWQGFDRERPLIRWIALGLAMKRRSPFSGYLAMTASARSIQCTGCRRVSAPGRRARHGERSLGGWHRERHSAPLRCAGDGRGEQQPKQQPGANRARASPARRLANHACSHSACPNFARLPSAVTSARAQSSDSPFYVVEPPILPEWPLDSRRSRTSDGETFGGIRNG